MNTMLINYKTRKEALKIGLAAAITGNASLDLEKEHQVLVTITRNNKTEFLTKLNSYLG